MSKTKISQLPEKTTNLSASAVAAWSDGGTTYKYTYQRLKNQILKEVYPVGAVILSMSMDTVDKVQTAYGGTWIRTAEGRALFGYQASNTNFNAANKTGGSLTHKHSTGNHTLTTAEMPSHYHGLVENYGCPKGNTGAWVMKGTSTGNTLYTIIEYNVTFPGNGVALVGETEATGSGGAHNHGDTGSTSTLPQYVTVYAYRRTA